MIRLTIMHGYLYTTVHDIVKVEDDSGQRTKFITKISFARDGTDTIRCEWVSESVEKVNELISSALTDAPDRLVNNLYQRLVAK